MYVDVKYTVWDRIQVDHRERAVLLNAAERGNISHPQDIYDILTDPTTNYMSETAEFVTTEENGSQSTIEIHNEEGSQLWDNSPKDKDPRHEVRNFIKTIRSHMDLNPEEVNFIHELANDLYNQALMK